MCILYLLPGFFAYIHMYIGSYKERGRQTGGHFTMAVRLVLDFFFGGFFWSGLGWGERRVVEPRSETNVGMWMCGCVDVWMCGRVCLSVHVRTYITQDKRTAPPRRAERGKRGRRRRINVFFFFLFFPCAQKCRFPPIPAQPSSPPSPMISVEK